MKKGGGVTSQLIDSYTFADAVVPDMKFEKFIEICSLAWHSRSNGCLLINKECDMNQGRYRIGFDTFITL